MICPVCDGEGWILVDMWAEWIPCEECQGCGLAYCCEGERAEPEDQ